MNVEDAASLVRVVEHGWPGRDFSEASALVYLEGLSDLPGPAAREALRVLVRVSEFRPSVAAIRRETARVLGVLPPGLDEALGQAARWAEWREQQGWNNGLRAADSVGPAVHDVVKRVVTDLGVALGDPTWRHLFRAAYKEAVVDAERELLAVDGAVLALGAG